MAEQMIPAVRCAISASASISVPSGRLRQPSAWACAPEVMVTVSSGRREMWVTGATTLRRCRHVSPWLMNKPSPISGSSATRCCADLRSTSAAPSTKVCLTASGLFTTTMLRRNTRWAKIGFENVSSGQIAMRLRRARRSRASGGSAFLGRCGYGGM